MGVRNALALCGRFLQLVADLSKNKNPLLSGLFIEEIVLSTLAPKTQRWVLFGLRLLQMQWRRTFPQGLHGLMHSSRRAEWAGDPKHVP